MERLFWYLLLVAQCYSASSAEDCSNSSRWTLAELGTGLGNPATVGFFGFRPDGSVVSTEFTTDGVIDGVGGLTDFETFHFGPEFSNLSYVEIPGFPFTAYSLDNLVVVVPEPSVLSLMGAGLLLLAWVVKHRRRR